MVEDKVLIGIRLVSDSITRTNFQYNSLHKPPEIKGNFNDCSINKGQKKNLTRNCQFIKDDAIKIGVVVTEMIFFEKNLIDFRELMEDQIKLPESFVFLFNNGYPISTKQESVVNLKSIITENNLVEIKRKFFSKRYGIMSICGEILGFVFLDEVLAASKIRDLIFDCLKDTQSFKIFKNNFFFCDRNGWPVTTEQENLLFGWDLICDNIIKIKTCICEINCNSKYLLEKRYNINSSFFEGTSHVDGNSNSINSSIKVNYLEDSNRNSFVTEKNNSLQNLQNGPYDLNLFGSSNHINYDYSSIPHQLSIDKNSVYNDFYNKDQYNLITEETIIKSSSIQHKPILISYVRKEAEQHARKLKTQLNNLGCDVFLDVDEITVGNDWQDTLNNAVANCEIFVPLITPNYGLTLWTNREIKYADIKEKIIVPINFLKTWPPECLAIQFATTQFLPWKTKEELDQDLVLDEVKATDIRFWDDKFIIRIAKQIADLIKKKSSEKYLNSNDSSSKNNLSIYEDEDLNKDIENNNKTNFVDINLDIDKKEEAFEVFEDSILIKEIIEEKTNEENFTNQVEENLIIEDDPCIMSTFSSFENSILNEKINEKKFENDVIIKPRSLKVVNNSKSKKSKSKKQKVLIVISAHPDQREIANKIKAELKIYYDVWCSTDIKSKKSFSTNETLCFDEVDYYKNTDAYRNKNFSFKEQNTIFNNENFIVDDKNSSKNGNEQNLSDSDYVSENISEKIAEIDVNNLTVHCLNSEKPNKITPSYINKKVKKCGKSQWYISSSEMNFQTCIKPDKLDEVITFKNYVNEARIVIILLSESYCQSRTSLRQAFYCDFRKQILPVYLEEIQKIPHAISKMISNIDLIKKKRFENSDNELIKKISTKVCEIVNDKNSLEAEIFHMKMNKLASHFEKKINFFNKKKLFVYVTGSTSFKKESTKTLCEKIGVCLARKEKIVLVTSGTIGVSDTVAYSFFEERKKLRCKNEKKIIDVSDSNSKPSKDKSFIQNLDKLIESKYLDVIHILPDCKVGNLRNKYRVSEDGTFDRLPYGYSMYLGETIEDRDSTVAQVFPYCILIEGGCSSAKLAQEFIYNENHVIPVCNTGGAAAGKFISEQECGNNITEMPAGVNESDWVSLKNFDLTGCELANAIYNIIESLSKFHQNKRFKFLESMEKFCRSYNKNKKNSDIIFLK